MFYSQSIIALIALLPSIVSASPTPLQRRFTGVNIQSGRTGFCLTLPSGGQAGANGIVLTTIDCAIATKWDINPGSGSVVVSGSGFALDAGTNPSNNVRAKVWTSYPGLSQQTWYLTADNRIAITGGNQCLDQGDSGPQTYQCTPGNTNQVWIVDPFKSAPASSTTAAAPTTTTFAPTPSNAPGPRSQIRWAGDNNACLSITSTPANGVPVTLQKCLGQGDPNVGGQNFFFVQGGGIQLAGTRFCLDANSNPANGGTAKLWDCYFGVPQQTWAAPGGGLLRTSNNQCLNVDNSNFSRLQTWACDAKDPNQQFTF